MNRGFRCSAASAKRAEPVEGTASTVGAFLLLEAPGPWGIHAVRDSRLPDEVKHRLAELEPVHGIRPLLIRRHAAGAGRSRTSRNHRLFAAYVHSERPSVQAGSLADVRELLDLDLGGLARGEGLGLAPHEDPLFLVCTHGRHDACCAELGRPLCRAMTQAAPEHTWEVSHIGGDRFAANVLVLPYGLYYGRLTPEEAGGLVAAHLAGRLQLENLRGRSAYAFPVQAAEIYLRRHLGLLDAGPLRLLEQRRQGPRTEAVFTVDGRQWLVEVHTERGDPRQLTCRAGSPAVGFSHRMVALTAV